MLYLMLKSPSKVNQVLILIVFLLMSDWLHMDYGSWGLLMIYSYYQLREKKVIKLVLIVLLNFLMGYSQIYAGLAVIPIAFHNRELGPKMKMFFYAFYPAHLLILYFINLLL